MLQREKTYLESNLVIWQRNRLTGDVVEEFLGDGVAELPADKVLEVDDRVLEIRVHRLPRGDAHRAVLSAKRNAGSKQVLNSFYKMLVIVKMGNTHKNLNKLASKLSFKL